MYTHKHPEVYAYKMIKLVQHTQTPDIFQSGCLPSVVLHILYSLSYTCLLFLFSGILWDWDLQHVDSMTRPMEILQQPRSHPLHFMKAHRNWWQDSLWGRVRPGNRSNKNSIWYGLTFVLTTHWTIHSRCFGSLGPRSTKDILNLSKIQLCEPYIFHIQCQ